MNYFKWYAKNPKTPDAIGWMNFVYKKRWEGLSGKTFLDAGPGSGYFIKNAPEESRVYSVDIGLESLKFTGSKNSVMATITALPFKNEIFDGVHCSHVIEHLLNPETAINEFRRVLRKGGTLMVLTPDIERYRFKFYVDHTHKTPFTADGLLGLMKVSGFTDIKIEHGLFHDTSIELLIRNNFKFLQDYIYKIKKILGVRHGKELICTAKKLND